jgi:hypothetical protein
MYLYTLSNVQWSPYHDASALDAQPPSAGPDPISGKRETSELTLPLPFSTPTPFPSPSHPHFSSIMGKSDKKTKSTTSDVPVKVVAAPAAVAKKDKKEKKAVRFPLPSCF